MHCTLVGIVVYIIYDQRKPMITMRIGVHIVGRTVVLISMVAQLVTGLS